MRVFLKFWLPVLVWMAVIFSASADTHSYEHSSRLFVPLLHWLFPHMPQRQIEALHELARKCCHLAEYSLFALLVFRALSQSPTRLPAWSWPRTGGAVLIVFLYACTDEFHQRFVPTRTARFADVLIDTAGGALGLLVLWLVHCIYRPQAQTHK